MYIFLLGEARSLLIVVGFGTEALLTTRGGFPGNGSSDDRCPFGYWGLMARAQGVPPLSYDISSFKTSRSILPSSGSPLESCPWGSRVPRGALYSKYDVIEFRVALPLPSLVQSGCPVFGDWYGLTAE